jgi:1-acyl-sn-glycerol-3-phosphate acyltransferase
MKKIVPGFYFIAVAVVRAIILIVGRVEVVGRENIPVQGSLIVVANHMNNADPPVIAAVLPRRLSFMAKQQIFQWPILGGLFRLGGVFPVKRSAADLGAMRKAMADLRSGQIIAIFPEGGRSKDARMHKAHPGAALLALRSEVPILPVAITGTEGIHIRRLPLDLIRMRRPRVLVTIGHPFFLPPVARVTAEEVEHSTDIIMGRIASLLPPSYRGEYAEMAAAYEAERAR